MLYFNTCLQLKMLQKMQLNLCNFSYHMNDSSSTPKNVGKIFEPYTEIYFKHNSRLILLTHEIFWVWFLGAQTSNDLQNALATTLATESVLL